MFDLRSKKANIIIRLFNFIPIILLVVPIYNFKIRSLSYVKTLKVYGTIFVLVRLTLYINFINGCTTVLYAGNITYHVFVEGILYTLYLIIQIKIIMNTCFLQRENWECLNRTIQEIDDSIGDAFQENPQKYIFYNFLQSLTVISITLTSMTYWMFHETVYQASFYLFTNTSSIFTCNIAFVVSVFSLAIYRRFQVLNRLISSSFRTDSSTFKWKDEPRATKFAVTRFHKLSYFPFIKKLAFSLYFSVEIYNKIFGSVILVQMGISLWALVYACGFILSHGGGSDILPYLAVFYITSFITVSFCFK